MKVEAIRLMKADQNTTIRIIGKYLREGDREAEPEMLLEIDTVAVVPEKK